MPPPPVRGGSPPRAGRLGGAALAAVAFLLLYCAALLVTPEYRNSIFAADDGGAAVAKTAKAPPPPAPLSAGDGSHNRSNTSHDARVAAVAEAVTEDDSTTAPKRVDDGVTVAPVPVAPVVNPVTTTANASHGSHSVETPTLQIQSAIPPTVVEDMEGWPFWKQMLAIKQQAAASLEEDSTTRQTTIPTATSAAAAAAAASTVDAPLQLLRLHEYNRRNNESNNATRHEPPPPLNGTTTATNRNVTTEGDNDGGFSDDADSNSGGNSSSYSYYNASKPTLAIVTSTRSTPEHQSASSAPLYVHLLRSVVATVTEAERNDEWNVHLYVAVDDTDAWWLSHYAELVPALPAWLQFTLAVFPDRGSHIPFNAMAKVAYDEGAEYYCRVNDDTEFSSRGWITLAVATLRHYDPPNVGVVGPWCGQGNTDIMTHDMVHRTHLDIFRGLYYPPAFGNWFLDDWISAVYARSVLGPSVHRAAVLPAWTVTHWLTVTRYQPDYLGAQWLPYEYERGRRLIAAYVAAHYPQSETAHRIAASLPRPQRVDASVVDAILAVLPPNGNLLVWGLTMDSQFWHRATTGRVAFLEDQDLHKSFQDHGLWRDHVHAIYPYLEFSPVTYTTARGNQDENYQTYVAGQTLHKNRNWCDLDMHKGLPEDIRSTVWDVILVDAPETCSTLDVCSDAGGPGVLQALYMTKVLVADQLLAAAAAANDSEAPAAAAANARRVTHVFVDDTDRQSEREFSTSLFAREPLRILPATSGDTGDDTPKNVSHFVFNVNDPIAAPNTAARCPPPRTRQRKTKRERFR